MIEIHHGIFWNFLASPLISYRYLWTFHEEELKIDAKKYHTLETHLDSYMPQQFIHLLYTLDIEWILQEDNYNGLTIPFTLGIDTETGIKALAVVHPEDSFNRKIGATIVRGRIRREKGELLGKKGMIRTPYSKLDSVPPWIYIPKKKEGDDKKDE